MLQFDSVVRLPRRTDHSARSVPPAGPGPPSTSRPWHL